MPATDSLALVRAAGGAGGSTTFEALQKADAMWYKLRHAKVRLWHAITKQCAPSQC